MTLPIAILLLSLALMPGGMQGQASTAEQDFRNGVPRFTEENRQANLAFVEWLRAFASRKQATPAQIALA